MVLNAFIERSFASVVAIETIGIEIFSFVHPKDLCSLSFTNSQIFEGVCSSLIKVALLQLPLILDGNAEVEYQVKVFKEHSFPDREHLLNHVVQKIQVAELKFPGQTPAESLVNVRDVLNREKKPGVYGATLMSETSDRFPDAEVAHVGYNYQKQNKDLAAVRCNNILERISSIENVTVVKSWMDYLLAQKNWLIGSWFWTCRHRQLDFQGVEGKGIMFSNLESEEQLEFQCTIMTRRRVGDDQVEHVQITPQFTVATRIATVENETPTSIPYLACSPILAEAATIVEDGYAMAIHAVHDEEDDHMYNESLPVAVVIKRKPRSFLSRIKSRSIRFDTSERR